MRTIFKFKSFPKTDKEIYLAIMEMKSIIDEIREQKDYPDDHALGEASNHLNNYLDSFEIQKPEAVAEANNWCFDEDTRQYGFKKD